MQLKQTCELLVATLERLGIQYVTMPEVLQALKSQPAANELLFKAIFELILQKQLGFTALQAAESWAVLKFTLADFVYFIEQALFSSGIPLFVSENQLKAVKEFAHLQPKALLAGLILICYQNGELEKTLRDNFCEKALTATKPAADKPGKLVSTVFKSVVDKSVVANMEPEPSAKLLRFLAHQQQKLVRECAEMIDNYSVAATAVDEQLEFAAKVMQKLVAECAEKQKQRQLLEKYDNAGEFGVGEKIVFEPKQAPEALDEVLRWAKDEFWLE